MLAGLCVITVLCVLPVIAGCRGFVGTRFSALEKNNGRFGAGMLYLEGKKRGRGRKNRCSGVTSGGGVAKNWRRSQFLSPVSGRLLILDYQLNCHAFPKRIVSKFMVNR